MRLFKKALSLLLVAAMLLTVLSACGTPAAPAASTPTGESTGTPTTSKPLEVVEIKMVHMLNPEIQLDNNPVLQYIEEKLGIRLVIEAPPVNNFWDRTSVMVATGDMPDFFLNGTDVNFEKWSDEGLLADITEDIKAYPNLMKNISTQQWGDTTAIHDGRIYGVPRPNSYDQWGFVINKKWLDAVGMQVPTTVEEFTKVCEAFTKNDPDGNGKADTFGASFGTDNGGSVWNLSNDFLSTAYSMSLHIGMPDLNGEYKLRPYSAGYLEYLNLQRDLYSKGIIDKEFITHKSLEYVEKFAQNRVGIIGASSKSYMTDVIEKYKLNPADYIYCAPLAQKAGDKPVYMMPPSNWCAFLINANTDKKADILRLLDWANSEEGFVITHFGFQGDHYNSYDLATRTLDQTPEQALALQKVTSNMFGFANAFDGRPIIEGGATAETTKLWQENTKQVNATVSNMYAPFVKCLFPMQTELPDDSQTLATLETRFVTGEISESELRSFLEGDYKTKTEKYATEYATFMNANPVEIK